VTPANDKRGSPIATNSWLSSHRIPKRPAKERQCGQGEASPPKNWLRQAYTKKRALFTPHWFICPQIESKLQLNGPAFQTEMDKLTFNAYSVVHDHHNRKLHRTSKAQRLSNTLIFPSSDTKNGFVSRISEIVQASLRRSEDSPQEQDVQVPRKWCQVVRRQPHEDGGHRKQYSSLLSPPK
jgi:hypothetical protein